MADSKITISEGTGTEVDTRTESTNGQHRQVVVIGDPSVNDGVALVHPSYGVSVIVRDIASSLIAGMTTLPAGSNTIGSVAGIGSTVAVYFSPSSPSVSIADRADVNRVYNVVDGTISVSGVGGTIATYFDPSEPTVKVKDTYSTSIIPGTVSGSTTAVSQEGGVIISPEASHNIKVYAFSLTTTAQVHLTAKFTDGANELWRYALQAPSAGISGANLAVSPPGYIFATGVGNTLVLMLDSASLVHYSVSYFKESA